MAILGLAMVLAAGALIYWGRDQVMLGDDLFYAQRLSENTLGYTILHSNLYLIALPMAVYKAMFEVFGIGSYLPYRLAAIVLALLCAGLFYVIASRRIGSLLALAPTILLLFLGSGWEVLLTGMRIPSLVAIASGLAAILLLEREDARGDAWAAVLLCVSATSHPSGLGFLGAAGVLIAFRPSAQRWRSSWVVLLPAALFGAFLIFYQRTVDSAPDPGFSDLLAFASESWTMLTAAVSGLSGVLEAPAYDRSLAQLASLALLALVIVGASVRRRQLRPTFWAAVAGLVILVVATRMSPGGFIRAPDAPRYLYPETILFLWILVELAGAWHGAGTSRTRTVVAGLATGVLVLGLWSNVAKLQDAGAGARTNSAIFQGQFSAYELERARLMPSYAPNPFFPTAGDYLAAAGAYGSIGLPPRELGQASQLVRVSADRAMVGSLGLGLSAARPGRAAPSCKSVRRVAELELPAGGASISGDGLADATFTLGRFADVPAARLPPAPVTEAAALRIPRDAAEIPWRLRVASPSPVSVCGPQGS